MQTVTISTFRFDGVADTVWAFTQMQLARGPLRRLPGIGFHKLFGSGSGASFHPRPNFGVYAVLATWPTLEHARAVLGDAPVFRRYREHAAETFTAYLTPTHAAGFWDRQEPFEVRAQHEQPRPLGVLTRATIRARGLLDFWKSVPGVSDSLVAEHGAHFAIGLGEIPWLHQVTFSIWPDVETMHRFAYKSGAHAQAIRSAKSRGWFKEDLFARFAVLDCEGTWHGAAPISPEVIRGGQDSRMHCVK